MESLQVVNMENPYITRTPVKEPEGFYGRDETIKKIFEDIARKQMQSHCIVGERRIGKTSLFHQIMHNEVQKKYIDSDNFNFVGTDMALFPDAPPTTFFEEWAKNISEIPEKSFTEPGYLTFRAFIRDATETGRKIVILLDEFETTINNKNIDKGFFEFLRALTQNYSISFILFSRIPLQYLLREEKFRSTYSSPFFNVLNISYLHFLEESEARELITEPAQKAGTNLTDLTDFILEQTYYHPFLLQMLSSIVFDHKQSSDATKEKILKEFKMQTEEFFTSLWNYSDVNEKKALKKLASHDTDIERTIRNNLDRRSLLRKDELKLFCPSFEEFVKTQEITNE